MKSYQVYLKHPFTMLISGPTGSGKTFFIKRLLEKVKTITNKPPKNITYFYGEYQPLFSQIKNVNFVQGISESYLEAISGDFPEWIIIDDLMVESANSKLISDLFTKGSHHRNLSVILITQNFFIRGKESRNITLNSHYLVLFKNPRDKSLASNIARQMYPTKIKIFQSEFEDATSEPYSYLFIDLKPDTPDEIRLLSHVLGEKEYIRVYSI
jgi:Cdc6-like AAA superfamily ATPase